MSEKPPERAVLVHQQPERWFDEESLDELHRLTTSAGAEVAMCLRAHRSKPHPATFLGSGKVTELRTHVHDRDADLVIVNNPLTPGQERNLEREIGCRVLDRTGLILDIFAQRAASHEGKLQVELAQLRYLSTRLVRGWTHLERQKGGIGLRGPGETQLETDRRLIGNRIKHLGKRLQKVSAQREIRRRSRRKVPIPTVCLVGYTNAGKSSLFNRITGARTHAADQLFATLDPTMRRVELPGGGAVVLSDTVGFIRDLPHTLVQAFHSTLEEVTQASMLLHVVDVNNLENDQHTEQVNKVLAEIGAADLPMIMVYNKIDLGNTTERLERDERGLPSRVWTSAASGAGVEALVAAIQETIDKENRCCTVRIPAGAGAVRAFLYRHARVVKDTAAETGGWMIQAEISMPELGRLYQQEGIGNCSVDEDAERGSITSVRAS